MTVWMMGFILWVKFMIRLMPDQKQKKMPGNR